MIKIIIISLNFFKKGLGTNNKVQGSISNSSESVGTNDIIKNN